MPRNPVDYSKSLIYKVEHLDKPELVYVGSTTNFVKRKASHKNGCNNEKNESYNCKKYVMMRENGGWECFKMVVIKEYPCKTKTELEIEEEKCRKELQSNLNSYRCHITKEEKIEQQREITKKYYEENRDEILKKKKEYDIKNRDENLKKKKEYRLKNPEKDKKYREENRDKILEKTKVKINCDCGSKFRIDGKKEHEKSVKHQLFIKT